MTVFFSTINAEKTAFPEVVSSAISANQVIASLAPILPSINDLKLSEVHIASLPRLIASTSNKTPNKIVIGESEANVKSVLGCGGSKKAYDIEWSGHRLALILPNTDADHIGVIRKKWTKALSEAPNTKVLRDLGLCTNPLCEVVPVAVDDVSIPGMIMLRYSDLPYKIVDRKNRSSFTIEKLPIPKDGLTPKSFIGSCSYVLEDCATLIRHGIGLGADSFNACFDGEKFRIFLSDLSGMSQSQIDPGTSPSRVRCNRYVNGLMDAWAGSFDKYDLERHRSFFKEFDKDIDGEDSKSICGQLTNRLFEKATH